MINHRAVFAFALAGVLSGCGGGGSAPHSGGGTVLPPGPSYTGGFSYDGSALSGAQQIGAAQVHQLSVDLVPRLSNAAGLLSYAQNVSNPASASYRRFLTPRQIGDQFGASAADYDAAIAYFRSAGIRVDGWPQRLMLHVTGTQTQVEHALHTTFAWYRKGKDAFLAPSVPPSLPTNVPVVGATNLIMHVQTFTNNVRVRPNGSVTNGVLYGYSPQQIAAAFDYNGAYAAGYTGKGISVGIIGTGPFSPADVPAYKSTFHIGGSGTAVMVAATDADNAGNAASGFAPPLPITAPQCGGSPVSPTPSCNPEDGETQIDTEQVASLAYDANVRYYLAYNPNDGCGAIGVACPPGAGIPLQGLGEIDAELQTAIADNASDILSLSFGGPEQALAGASFNASGHGLEPLEFAALVSEGIAVFVSSGDSGAEQCQTWSAAPAPDSVCTAYPSTDPSVVSVGGVNAPLDTRGRFVGPLTGWGVETTNGFGGSGGGVSAYFEQPSFQGGVPGITGSMRNVPDVALTADAMTGVAVLMYADPAFSQYRAFEPFGGTSVAAPEMAAMWALVLQACSAHATCATAGGSKPYRLGDPDPLFYKIYRNPKAYAATFTDVLYGNNAQQSTCTAGPTPCPPPTLDPGYNAGTGYDLVTGIGVPYARALITEVTGS